MKDVDKQIIKEAVYEVIEPFVARVAQDYEESRRWMERIEQRLDAIEQRLDAVEQRLGHLERRVDNLERRMTRLEVEMQEVKRRLESLEQRLAERGFVESEAIARERWATFADLRRLELRVTQLEAAVFHGRGERAASV